MEKILREVLAEDKNILARRDDLISALNEKVPPELKRKYASIKKALELNVGEVFAVGEEDHEAAKVKAAQILKDSGMQEARVNLVVETFVKALDWDKAPVEVEPEEVEPPEPPEPKSPEPELELPEPPPKVSAPPPQPPQPPKTSTPPPAPAKSSNGALIGIIGVLLAVIFFLVSGKPDDDSKSAPEPEPVVAQVPEPVQKPEPVKKPEPPPVKSETQSYRDARSELSLNGMDLRIDFTRVRDILGNSASMESSGGYDRYNYGSIEVAVHDGKVEAFVAKDPKFKTLRGLSVGASYSDVVKAYGEPQHVMEIDKLILYEYDFSAMDNHQGLLRFAVNKSDSRVNYISERIIDNDPPPPDNSKENIRLASEAFMNYHRAITNDDYSAAYSLMTEGRKQIMGTPQQFSDGYRTTISSAITKIEPVSASNEVVILDYILEARDRADNGRTVYRKFRGQVHMSNIFGAWKINEVQSQKIDETIEK
ncbi:MAG: hypothetical protein J5809_02385 [Selenomonadaceae bacterium]|nr:hypothetical protein [Selenomonadaceae bacterium]